MTARWLAIIGIGEDGRAGLGQRALALIDAAGLVVGGKRHLELIGPTSGEQRVWASPIEATIPGILERRGTPVTVLVSGDPFWFGAGVTLARAIPPDEMEVIPAPSSFSLAAARLGWPLQDTTTLGLNMRGQTPLLRRHLHHGRRILALSLNGETPHEVAALAVDSGFGASQLTVLEALGGPREKIRSCLACDFAFEDIDPLNIVGLDVVAGNEAGPLPFTAGLPDSLYESDGQLTKREVRAITLSALAPGAGEFLWDIGTGSGSVAIEWLLAHPANRAVGIELREDRAARATRNAIALGVPKLIVQTGAAADALDGLAPPDAVFIGGGASSPGLIERCWSALKPGGRIVVNGVTLETDAILFAARGRFGGTLTRIGIERAEPVGTRTGWRAAMPVTQWAARKPKVTS